MIVILVLHKQMFLYVNIEYGSFYSNENFNKGTCLIVMQIM